jgi:hypothetical protein
MWKIFIEICILFNYLNIKFFVSLNATFLFLGSLSYALRAQVNMTLIFKLRRVYFLYWSFLLLVFLKNVNFTLYYPLYVRINNLFMNNNVSVLLN